MSDQIYFGYRGPSRGGRLYYDEQSYTPTIDLRDAERVATGGKPYPYPQPDPAMPYTTGYQTQMQQYEDAWELDPALLGQKPRPKPRPRSRQNGKLDTVYRKKPAYNSHWIDVPFLFAWLAWWVSLGFPTMILAAGLTSGLPSNDGAIGAIVWVLLDIIVSFVATTVSRWYHAHKTRAISRVHAEMDKRLDHRWIDRRY